MQEFILYIHDDEYDIDNVLIKKGAFKQTSIKRGTGYTTCKKGDLVHIYIESQRQIKYTCTAVNVNKEEEFIILAWYDEYKKGIKLAELEEKFGVKGGAHKTWDKKHMNGFYNKVKHRGTRVTSK